MKDTLVAGVAAAAMGFAVATVVWPRWVTAGPPRFIGAPDGTWEVSSAESRRTLSRPVDLGEADGWLVVGRMSLPSPVERARLFLAASCNGVDRRFPARVPVGEGDVTLVVPEPLTGCAVRVGALVVGDGVLEIGELRVLPARRSVWWAASFVAAMAGYTLAGGAAAIRLWRGARVLAVVVAALIVVGVCLPGDRLDVVLLSIPGSDPADLGVDLWVRPTVTGIAQKLGGHGLAFAALGWLGRRSGAPAGVVLARCLGFAVATEGLQLLVPGRSGRWEDVVLDTVAAAIGVLVGAKRR